MIQKINILYVDDEEHNLISFRATFRTRYRVFTALSGEEAMAVLKENKVEIVITDQRMPKMTGVELLEQIVALYPEPVRILLTGYSDMAAVVDAVNKGKIFHYLNKPWNEDELDAAIQKAYQAYLEKQRLRELNDQLSLTNEQLEFLVRQRLLS